MYIVAARKFLLEVHTEMNDTNLHSNPFTHYDYVSFCMYYNYYNVDNCVIGSHGNLTYTKIT